MAPAFPADDQSCRLSLFFWAFFFFFFVSFDFIVSRRFYPHHVCQSVIEECGSQVKAVSPGWFASRYSAWLNKQHRAGRERKRGEDRGGALVHSLPPGRLGGLDAGGTKGALFVLCRQNGGSCCCLGALCPPSGETVQDPSALNNLPPSLLLSHSHSLTHARPSIPISPISWGRAAFCRCPGERADVQPQEDRTFIVSVARQSAFYCH